MVKTILIIDDEPHLRLTLSRILRRVGYQTLEAASADEGLALLENYPVDLIFLDLCMPRRSGMDILPEIRRLHPAIPVLILTADGSIQKAIESFRSGATEYLLKPVEPGQIVTKVEDLLNQDCDENSALQSGLLEDDDCLIRRHDREPGAVIDYGLLTLDFEKCQVSMAGKIIALTPCSLEYLYILGQHAPQTVTFSTLVNEAQGYQLTDLEAQDLARWRIYRLRKLLEIDPNDPRLILTDPGIGYRLNLAGY